MSDPTYVLVTSTTDEVAVEAGTTTVAVEAVLAVWDRDNVGASNRRYRRFGTVHTDSVSRQKS